MTCKCSSNSLKNISAIDSYPCCAKISVKLKDDAKKQVGEFGGTYKYIGNLNGRKYWSRSGEKRAIWYVPEYKDWAIGNGGIYLGGEKRYITSVSDLETTCPNNASNSWKYWDGNNWISTNGVELNCEGM